MMPNQSFEPTPNGVAQLKRWNHSAYRTAAIGADNHCMAGMRTYAYAADSKGVSVESSKGKKAKAVPRYKNSYALLIGISNYSAGWPDLESVPGELTKVEASLKGQGFEVVTHLDLDGYQLKQAFEDFIGRYG